MASKMQQRAIQLELPKNDNLDIEFDGLAYVVPSGKGKKEVLHKISGKFNSGELTAIMGPSGAGKSSLLNILTGFQKIGTSGSIRCTGQEDKADGKIRYKKDCCYILQDDRLCPLFTVWEIMNMAAKLKIGDSISQKAKEILINDILDTLGLKNTLDTRCSRLSGGQKKRLSIALELIDNPPIMFLDEPTTGLDSSSSLQCVSMLKNLARGGRTIVCTIHQPSATIFEMFDHIYVLADGHCIYQGAATNTVSFLSSVGLECPQYHNPADYLLEVANGEYGNFVEKLAAVAEETNWRMIEPSNMVAEKEMLENAKTTKTMVLIQSPSEWYKFRVLFKRSTIQLYRDWTVTHLKLLLHFLVGIFVGVLYLNYGNDGSKSLKNIGYFIVSIVYLIYTSMMPAVVRFPAEVPIIKKESFNNWYKLRTYYIANILANMPVQILFAIVYTIISYAISGQPFEGGRICKFFAVTILVTLTAEGIGIIFGTTVNPVTVTHLKLVLHAAIALLLGLLYKDMGNNGFTALPNAGYFLVTLTYLSYTAMLPAVVRFPAEVPVIRKENFNNWYKLRTYYISSTLANIPVQVLGAFIYTTITYFLSGQLFELNRYLMFVTITTLVTLTADGIGTVIGTILNPVNGTFIGAVFTAYLILLSGFFILFNHMNKFGYVITYTSYIAFGMEGIMHAMYGFDRANLPCPEEETYCHFKSPDNVLSEFGMTKNNYIVDISYLASHFLIAKVVGFCTLLKLTKSN